MEKNKNIPVIYFKFGLMALQRGMNMRRTTFSWGSGVHIWEIYLAEKKSKKNVFADDLRYSEGMAAAGVLAKISQQLETLINTGACNAPAPVTHRRL